MRPVVFRFLVAAALLTGWSLAYQNIVRAAAPDPFIVYTAGQYHMTWTSSNRIDMARSKTLKGLLIGRVRTVYTENNQTRSGNIWAPEMHRIDDVWYIFYSSSNSTQDCAEGCRPRVLQGCNDESPYYCSYKWRADLVPPAGSQGGADGRNPFGIDASYLEVPGWGRYALVSAMSGRAVQSVQIGQLNTSDWNVTSWNVLSEPDQPWERNVSNSRPREEWIGDSAINEGPHPLYHNGQIWISYSGSHCQTPNYALGLLQYLGGDPVSRSSWSKSTKPVLTSANGNYGVGHNCFFNSPDGKETWIAFHSQAYRLGECDDSRYTVAQRVQFVGNNTPSFEAPYDLDAVQDPPSGENFTSQAMDQGEFPLEDPYWL